MMTDVRLLTSWAWRFTANVQREWMVRCRRLPRDDRMILRKRDANLPGKPMDEYEFGNEKGVPARCRLLKFGRKDDRPWMCLGRPREEKGGRA